MLQVYVALDSPDAPPHPRLCGFKRVTLKAGEEKSFTVELDPYTFTVIDGAGERKAFKGPAVLYAGTSHPDALSTRLTGTEPAALLVQAD